jgi:long-chain fatty acid transport protein
MAMRTSIRIALITTAAFGAIGLGVGKSQADPGGFALKQSSYFQGSSWAGIAAGGASISSMFWNPATITQAGLGLTAEAAGTIDSPHATITPLLATSPTGVGLTPLGSSGDLFDKATFVPSFYAVYGLTNSLSFGLAVNSPFGLKTQPQNPLWSGMFYAEESNVKTIDATPTVAWKVNNWLSVGGGVQIQYLTVRLDSAFPGSGVTGPFPFLAPFSPDQLDLRGNSWAVGYTAGATITPTSWTTIGVGYRSGLDQRTHGDLFRPGFVTPVAVPGLGLIPFALPAVSTNFSATVPLPGAVTASIRQKITNSVTLLGTVEWTNWSRLNTVPVVTPVALPGVPTQLSFGWRDSWLVSGGLEYQYNRYLALRTGIAWDQSPITDQTRSPRLPDTDRWWVSGGATYKYNEQLSFDLAYSHIFLRDASINLSPTSGNPTFNPGLGTFIANSSAWVDVFSVALRYRFVPPQPAIVRKG